MSGLEPFLAAAAAAASEAAAAAGSAIAGTTAATAGTTAAAAAGSAGLAAGTAGATAATAGLTAAQIASGVGALSSAAGAGAQLLSEAPKFKTPTAPSRDQAQLAADQRARDLKRRGRGATLLTSPAGVTSAPTLGTPSLMGTA